MREAEEFAEREAGSHPGIGHLGEPLWHRTFQASKKAYIAGVEDTRDRLNPHILKLQMLVLLTDPAVSDQEMNTLSAKQWAEYMRWITEKRPETTLKDKE